MAYLPSFGKGFLFSVFKKKCAPLQQINYGSLQDLYQQLSSFQKSLSDLEQKRLPKKLEDFQKKLKRLYRQEKSIFPEVKMELNHTYQFFCRTTDEIIFGSQDNPKEVTLEQLTTLTQNMAEFGLNTYIKDLIPKVHVHKALYDTIQHRFVKIEEKLSRILFKGYASFSNITNKYSFLEEKQYKGDFKFELIEDLHIIEKASQCLYHCALFNQLRSKLALACQLIITKQLDNITDIALVRIIYSLAAAGRPLRFVQRNFNQIAHRIKNYPLQLLYYMAMSNIEDSVLVKHLLGDLSFEPKNVSEQFLANILKTNLALRYEIDVKIANKPQFMIPNQKNGGQLFFEQFLQRYQYKYSTSQQEITQNFRLYQIVDKNFMCLDHYLVNKQKLDLNGLGLIFKQHFINNNVPLKHINWPRMLEMERRGQKDQYVLSKFKGIERPKIVKVRFYD